MGRVVGVMVAGTLLAAAPASAAELQAAYDYYVPGQGFQIGLVNAATGAPITLPAGVNTAEDELHPALSADGRYLAFTRMRIQTQLDGSFTVPPQRSIQLYDLQAGQLVPFGAGAGGAGPTFQRTGSAGTLADLAFGVSVERFLTPDGDARLGRAVQFNPTPSTSTSNLATTLPSLDNVFVPHVGVVRGAFFERVEGHTVCTPNCTSPRELRMSTLVTHDPVTGAPGVARARLSIVGMAGNTSSLASVTLKTTDFGDSDGNAGHATSRQGDDLVALDRVISGGQSDIHTIFYPAASATTGAPAPITTTSDERFPAWSPDGNQLAFVRTVSGRRKLNVFDLTPGIQAIINPAVDLGTEAPSPQTRAFQNIWGNVSVAPVPAAPAVVCDLACRVRQVTTLSPTVVNARSKVGIFVVKRSGGTKTVLGVKQPKIKVIGRVPLGTAKQGKNRFNWNMKVDGKRLKPGKYLLTYRLLRGDKVTSTSASIPFTVKR
ncbi:hypothetical protein OJ998_35820 [Solirubrobacter taibaiensis]|nr:hypothetical protein [Solirubrobacter taibaiensis]